MRRKMNTANNIILRRNFITRRKAVELAIKAKTRMKELERFQRRLDQCPPSTVAKCLKSHNRTKH